MFNIYSSVFTFSPRVIYIWTPWFLLWAIFIYGFHLNAELNILSENRLQKCICVKLFSLPDVIGARPTQIFLWIYREREWWSWESFVKVEWCLCSGEPLYKCNAMSATPPAEGGAGAVVPAEPLALDDRDAEPRTPMKRLGSTRKLAAFTSK